jgi:NAD(P)-dependent dehydrogenase (short-subunit alcohol dehydrogenase family)
MSRWAREGLLAGKVALVTGAGRGLGRAIAVGLAGAGATIAIVEADAETGEEARRELEALGAGAICAVADVADATDVDAAFERVADELGGLDILVNNAGISRAGPATHEVTDRDWLDSIGVMQTGVYYCMRAAARIMIPAGGGAITNIASVRGYSPRPGRITYSSPKAAVIMMSRTAAGEWGQYGIRVNAVAPGFMKTPMHDADVAKGTFDEASMLAVTPLGRFGRPEELADLVVFLSSESASYITGSCITIDGGLTTIPSG